MRLFIVAAGALAIAACSNNDQHDNTMNVDENLTAENIVSNDVTAIDAVTGDAANMAADSEINAIDLGNGDEALNNSAPKAPSSKAPVKPNKPAAKASKPSPAQPTEPTGNSA